tara:strand:- start:5246 stop:6184 length:939 start_codon:yes stop_codon:yes gene_type:complete
MISSTNRRSFLIKSTQATVGAALVSSGSAKANAERMTFGFSTYGMKTMKTEDAIRTLDQIGYDSVEINIWNGWDADPKKLSQKRRAAIRKMLSDTGLILSSFMGVLKSTDKAADRQKVKDHIKQAAELGREFAPGATPMLQSTLSGKKWEDMKELYLKLIDEWADVAEQEKIIVAIKPHRGGALSRPSEAAWLLNKVGNPKSIRMCYDYSHYDFRDMTLEQTIKDALPITAHIAIKEAVMKDGKVGFVNPGMGGRTDFAKLLRLFHEGGYRGDVCCEVSGMVWNKKGYDPVASAKQCYASIAPKFKEAGLKR